MGLLHFTALWLDVHLKIDEKSFWNLMTNEELEDLIKYNISF